MSQLVKLLIKNKEKQLVLVHSIGMAAPQILNFQERNHLHSWGKNLLSRKNLRIFTQEVQTKLLFWQIMQLSHLIHRQKHIRWMKNFSKLLIPYHKHFLRLFAILSLHAPLLFVVLYGVIHTLRRQKYKISKFLWIKILCHQKSWHSMFLIFVFQLSIILILIGVIANIERQFMGKKL